VPLYFPKLSQINYDLMFKYEMTYISATFGADSINTAKVTSHKT